jgi:hypothetical protein
MEGGEPVQLTTLNMVQTIQNGLLMVKNIILIKSLQELRKDSILNKSWYQPGQWKTRV